MNDLIQEYSNLLKAISSKYAKNNPKSFLGEEDYYQESILVLMDLYNQNLYDENKGSFKYFLVRCVKNRLQNLVNETSYPFSGTSGIIPLLIKIQKLEEENLSEEEIKDSLKISDQRYFEIQNLKKSETHEEQIPDKINDLEVISYITEKLNTEEKILFNLILKELSIKQIAYRQKKSYETLRKRVNTLIEKVEVIYNEYQQNY